MSHTPGPWHIKRDDNFYIIPTDPPTEDMINGGYIIAELSGPDDENNASLIAAAPDLLAALQIAYARLVELDHREHSPTALSFARAAIAKATGTTAGGTGHPDT